MATIEPRLIHLLNDSTSPEPEHIDLPPLHELLPRPLPPIDRDGRSDLDLGISPNHLNLDETSPRRYQDDIYQDSSNYTGTSTSYPLKLRKNFPDSSDSYLSHSNSIEDILDGSDDGSKKRHRIHPGKEEYLQLPQPVKKQKSKTQILPGPDLPPIINGLHKPPPHPVLFPPIASSSFGDNEARQLRPLQEFTYSFDDRPNQTKPAEFDKSSNKTRKPATKPRRKWSEKETNHLLLGVSRHGVGKWTAILEDPDFSFDGRKAGDLKDRFRTCCPAELRGNKPDSQGPSTPVIQPKSSRKGMFPENILQAEDSSTPGGTVSSPNETDGASKQQTKTRAHRKKITDLQNLGICAPFKKSHRRERTPFTPEDDAAILEGLEQYGPAWTKIQRDPRFHLSNRQPTDLRDRIRNKYPHVFQNMEKAGILKENPGNAVMEPTATTSMDNSLRTTKGTAIEPQILNRTGSGDDLLKWPAQFADSRPTHSSPPSPIITHLTGGEMDISRLLLDDSQLT